MIHVKIIRHEDDPICCRASVGGDKETGFYIVYRNKPDDVLCALKAVVTAMEGMISSKHEMEVNEELTAAITEI